MFSRTAPSILLFGADGTLMGWRPLSIVQPVDYQRQSKLYHCLRTLCFLILYVNDSDPIIVYFGYAASVSQPNVGIIYLLGTTASSYSFHARTYPTTL